MTGILALDQGTTGTKAYLWRDGTVHLVGRAAHRQIRPRPGWVEHDPLELLGHRVGVGRVQAAQVRIEER